MRTVLLYSGGLDSLMLHRLLRPDVLLYVDTRSPYAAAERSRLPPSTEVVEFDLRRWERPDGIVPCRNLYFVTVASTFGEFIALGSTKGDRVHDGSPLFASSASHLLTYLWSPQHWTEGRRIRVDMPIKDLTKAEAVALFVRNGGDAEWLARAAFSCYRGGDVECMDCLCCARKWVALTLNGVAMARSAEPYVRSELVPLIRAGRSRRPGEDKDILRAVGEA
jgi:7-cyano-7-deazaguanine synthase in queuosine biosynthesis